MFHFAGLSSMGYGFTHGYTGTTPYGLPHSDTSGSLPVCGSPELFAAYRVLHRLLAPRHPPYALPNLTIPGSGAPAGPFPGLTRVPAYTTGLPSVSQRPLSCAYLRWRPAGFPFCLINLLFLCALLFRSLCGFQRSPRPPLPVGRVKWWR